MHYMLVNLLHSHYIQHVMCVITCPLHAIEDANDTGTYRYVPSCAKIRPNHTQYVLVRTFPVYGGTWQYMAVHAKFYHGTWRYMAVHGSVYHGLWQYMAVHGCTWA